MDLATFSSVDQVQTPPPGIPSLHQRPARGALAVLVSLARKASSMNRKVPIAVKNRHGHVSAKMEEYAEKKAEHLLRFHTRISRIDVVVDGPHDAPELELIVQVDGSANLVAKESNTHFTVAMDQVIDKMERQLIKANQKLKSHKGDIPLSRVDDGSEPIEPEESFDDAVRKKLDS